jgi:hypothetical protein
MDNDVDFRDDFFDFQNVSGNVVRPEHGILVPTSVAGCCSPVLGLGFCLVSHRDGSELRVRFGHDPTELLCTSALS